MRSVKHFTGALVTQVGLCLSFSLCATTAQISSLGTMKNFRIPDFYEASEVSVGQTNRLKALITGEEARLRPGGWATVKQVRIESYSPEGLTNLITQAPECQVNSSTREVFSAGPLEIRTGDGQFLTQGDGFFCQITNYSIFISNNVRTTLRELSGDRFSSLALSGLTKAGDSNTNATASPQAPITIHSRQLNFERDANRAIYTDNVKVDNERMTLKSEFLKLEMDTNNATQSILARRDVHITSKDDASSAFADELIYLANTNKEMLELVGNAHWEDGRRSGQADWMTFDLRQNRLVARQQAHMKLPRSVIQSEAGSKVLTNVQSNAPPASAVSSNQFIEIAAEWMAIQLPTTNQPYRWFAAKTNVVITSPADHSRATGQAADYLEASGQLILDGQAQWQDDQRLIKAQSLRYNRSNSVFQAQGKAFVRLTLSSLGRPKSLVGEAPEEEGKANSLTNQFIEVECDNFDFLADQLTFREDVKGRLLAGDTLQGTLECHEMELNFRSNQVERIEIRQQVRAEQLPLGGPRQKRTGRLLICEILEADIAPDGYFQRIEAQTNVVLVQRDWDAGNVIPTKTTLAAEVMTADFFPQTNLVAVFNATGHFAGIRDDKSARGNQAIFTATNDLLVLRGNAELGIADGVVKIPNDLRLHPFQRWLREGEIGPFGLPMLPASKSLMNSPTESPE